MELITCRQVSFAYEGTTALTQVDFSIRQGDYLCIVGANGSGKSTLVKGLLKLKSPSGGTIAFSKELRANEIGYLPQQTAAQKDFPASVYEVVLSGRIGQSGWSPFYSKEDKQQALSNMELLGITDLKNRCYRELSGGQQQRVLLARALCASQKILLLDEPVSGLDPLVTEELYEIIRKLNAEKGITIVMVSHDIRAAVRDASHILHLSNRQLFFGSTAAYQKTQIAQIFLGGDVPC